MLDVYGSLGSAQSSKCAGSAVFPANYMTGAAPPAPLTGFGAGRWGDPSKGLSTGAKVLIALGIVAAGVAVYSMASGAGTLAANPRKPRAKKLTEFEELQRSLTRQWTKARVLSDVEPLVRAAGKPGGRPVVFLVSNNFSQGPTERMIAQILSGSEFVHASLSYPGVLAHAQTLGGRPLVFHDAQDLRSGLFALVKLRKQDPNQPILAVGHAESTLPTLFGQPAAYSSSDEQIIKQAAVALDARLVVQENGQWVEYTPGPVSNPTEFPRPLDKTSPDVKFVVFCYAPGDPPISASFATKKDAVAWAKYKCSEEGDRYRVVPWPPPEERTRKSNDAYSPFEEHLRGGKASGMRPEDFDPVELARGTKHELEHTRDREIATEIAMDHLAEDEAYYEKLDAMERGSFRDNPKLQWQPDGWARLAPGQFYRIRQRAQGEWLVVFDAPGGESVVGAERTPALAKKLAQEHANRTQRDNPCGCAVG